MAKLKKLSKTSKKAQKKGNKRAYEYSDKERKYLKKMGLKIAYDLEHRFEEPRPIEWLSWETQIARSALREIMAGRSNAKWLTLVAIANAFGYKSFDEFVREALR